jgi:hypothetical protein
MRKCLQDVAIGAGLAMLVIVVMLFAAFDSSFIYGGF